MKNFLGIIGGLGPEASAYFYQMIINRTEALKDQDHINSIILNYAEIPNRTDYILDNSKPSPLPYLLESVKILNNLGAAVIAIPCNTSFYFYEELQKESNVKILNMIQDTSDYLREKGIKKVGILATTGTIKSNLYQEACLKNNIETIILDELHQEILMNIIYDQIKSNKEINKEDFEKIDRYMKLNKIEALVMGCTELSILKNRFNLNEFYVDPLEIETKIILKLFDKNYK